MSQLIYAFAAVAVASVLSLQFLTGARTIQRGVHRNELLTQVAGVAGEVLEEIGRRAFDHRTRDDLFESPPASPSELTSARSFGGVPLDQCDSLCRDIDDFHGLTLQRNAGGFDFDVRVVVRYVDAEDPERGMRGATFAKEVLLRITNPNLYRPNQPDTPQTIEIGRVFTYQQTNSAGG